MVCYLVYPGYQHLEGDRCPCLESRSQHCMLLLPSRTVVCLPRMFTFLPNCVNRMYRYAEKKCIRLMEDYRGLLICFFCLPASFIFDFVLGVWLFVRGCLYSAPWKHDDRVRKIQEKVRKWNKLPIDERKPLCTARPNWLSLSTTFFRKDRCHKIPVDLFDILHLDEENMVVRVEPLVSVRSICEYLIPRGYALAVTLEIADATCGGLALAVGMTTHSHKVGLYQENVVSYDVVLSDGSLVHATAKNDHSDLFNTLPWSHGTLGFLVALELKIIPVKPYVHMRYIPVTRRKRYCSMIRELSGATNRLQKTPDFLEATVFSRDRAVIMVGDFAQVRTREDRKKINRVSRWYKPWFYKHVKSFLKKGESDEFIPLQHYLFRHNRSIFWVLESMIPLANNPLFRLYFGWLCPPKPAFLKFTTTAAVREMTFTKLVFQDIVLPMTVLEKSIDKAEELFDIYPLLIYPCRIYDHGSRKGQLRPPKSSQMTSGTNYGMFYDLGIYGTPGPVKRRQKYDAVGAMRDMEKFTKDAGGYPFLYADIFATQKEFEQMFDLTAYEKARKKYHAEGAFPHLYDKVKPEIDVMAIGKRFAENHGHESD